MQFKNILRLFVLLVSLQSFGQFTPIETENKDQSVYLDLTEFSKQLSSVNNPLKSQTNNAQIKTDFAIISLPQTDGSVELYEVSPTKVLPLNLREIYPDIQTFKGHCISHPEKTIRFTLSDLGMMGLIRSATDMVFIEPLDLENNLFVYKKNPPRAVECLVDEVSKYVPTALKSSSSNSNGSQKKVYTIAVAATGEFTAINGGTSGAMAAIANIINQINDVYENDLGIELQVASNNNSIIFPDAATDPFNPGSNNLTGEAQSGISANMAASNYDLGQVFHYLGSAGAGQGVAGIGVVCNSTLKASGWSAYGLSGGFNSLFDIAIHEIAHQFSAEHTFHGTDSSCNQKSANYAYEPGSGTTIMAYSGICNTHNIGSLNGDYYFHAASLEQMSNFSNSISCASTTPSGNTPPVANAGANKAIPVNTPFELEGVGTDADGDNLTYCWEQFNTDGIASTANTHPNDAANVVGKPLFRSFPPTTNPVRSFPQASDILGNTQTIGEILSNVAQTSTFRLTVRDNSHLDNNSTAGGFDCDDMTVQFVGNANTNANDAFFITSPNTSTTWTSGSNATISWNVGVSNSAPVNCGNVDIYLSTNNGLSFDHLIVSSTPNDGSHTFPAPSLPSTSSILIKIKCSDNVFFDVNNASISLNNTSCPANGSTIGPISSVTGNFGTSALNLSLSPDYGTTQSSHFFSSTTSDPTTPLTGFQNSDGSCFFFGGNLPHYTTFEFFVDTDGQYTFAFTNDSSFPPVMNLYNSSFDANATCQNWIGSNLAFSGSSVAGLASPTVNLLTGTKYILVVSGFNDGESGTYTVNFSNNVGGSVYDGPIPAGAGFSYTYVAVDANDNIAAISSLADFTALVDGSYTIYGLSYDGSTLNPITLVGTSFASARSNALSGNFCGHFSSNNIPMTILCPTGNCGGPSNYPETIPLVQGWNLISSSCVMDDLALETVFAGIASQTIQVKDLSGTYTPLFNFNDIGNWDLDEGYFVKMVSAQTLTLDCTADINYANTPIQLQQGWNLLAYTGNNPINAAIALSGIDSDITQVKDLGGTYIPSFGFNDLNGGTGQLVPGQGYMIKMTNAATFTYPIGLGKKGPEGFIPNSNPIVKPSHYVNPHPLHPNNAVLAFPNLSNCPLSNGDEIGIFAPSGKLMGSAVYQDKPFALMMYGDDATETNDGAGIQEGETYIIKAWSAASGTEQILLVDYAKGSPLFQTNSYAEVSFKNDQVTAIESLELSNLQVYPNPSKGFINLSLNLEQAGTVTLDLIDAQGRTVTQSKHSVTNAENLIQMDLSEYADGVYFLKVQQNDMEEFVRFVLMQ